MGAPLRTRDGVIPFCFLSPPRSFACSFCLAADKTVGTVVGIERRGVSSVSWIFRISNMNGRSASKVSTEATASILALPPKGHCYPRPVNPAILAARASPSVGGGSI